MLLWLLFALMTAASIAVILRPLMRPAAPSSPGGAGTVAVYRDQLAEIDTELARGVIDKTEAEAARLEVSRRLLAAADGQSPASLPPSSDVGRRLTFTVACFVPLFTLALYLVYGAPGMPGMPHAEVMQAVARQQKVANDQVTALVAKVEARLREAPQDGKGWDVLAPVYFKLGRFRDAAEAYQRAITLLGETVARVNGFADASVFAADGIVTEEARKAYERVLALDATRVEARFWLALAKEQDGDLTGARADLEKLVAEAPQDAPWRSAVEERARAIAARLDGKSPTHDQIEASKDLSPADRQQMIEGMVAGLAERLKKDGKDLAGWLRLVRAYSVLQRPDAARAALADARKALAGDDKAMGELSQLATSLGLGS